MLGLTAKDNISHSCLNFHHVHQNNDAVRLLLCCRSSWSALKRACTPWMSSRTPWLISLVWDQSFRSTSSKSRRNCWWLLVRCSPSCSPVHQKKKKVDRAAGFGSECCSQIQKLLSTNITSCLISIIGATQLIINHSNLWKCPCGETSAAV